MENLKNIDLFLYRISPAIQDRGKKILKNNLIKGFNKTDEGFEFFIESESLHDTYYVKIFLHDKNIIDAECSCPYYQEHGEFCKHIAGAIFYLKENLNKIQKIDESSLKQPVKTPIEEYLNNLSKDELISIILDYSKKDKEFFNYLEILTNSQNFEKLKDKVKKIIEDLDKYYKDAPFESQTFINAIKNLDEIFSQVEKLNQKEKLKDLLEIYYQGLRKLIRKYFINYSYDKEEINAVFNIYFKYLIKLDDLELFSKNLKEVYTKLYYMISNEKYVANLLLNHVNYKNAEKIIDILENVFSNFNFEDYIILLVEKYFPERKISYYYKYKDRPSVLNKLLSYLEERGDYNEIIRVLEDTFNKGYITENPHFLRKYLDILEKLENKEKLKQTLINLYLKTLGISYLTELFKKFNEEWKEIKEFLNIKITGNNLEILHRLNLAILEKDINTIENIVINLNVDDTNKIMFVGDFIIQSFEFDPDKALYVYLNFAEKILRKNSSFRSSEAVAFQLEKLIRLGFKSYADKIKEELLKIFPKRKRLREVLDF